ncbi:MAG TPA: outer membrane protein transport protein, partial [Methylomirabilota bacterium]|nr:outer membrane protein transport protein [Methylomirabilota bacterium]
PGARALGMGGAFVAVADDATAVIANPAGLTILQRPELSGEVKFTRFTNTFDAFSNTPDDAFGDNFHSHDFHDSVVTPSFFSFVYPTERLVVAAFVRELINYKSNFETQGVFFKDPTGGAECLGGVCRLFPVKSELEIQALNFGLGTGLNLAKDNPLLPNIGASLEFSVGRIRSRLERFDFGGALASTETIDGTDVGVGFNVGALWHPVKDMGLGIVYRRGPRYDVQQTITNVGGTTTVLDFGFKVPDVAAVGLSYRFFERLTVGFEASYIQYSQLVKNFQVPLADAIATKYRVDDALELHLGAEYIFFVKDIPLAARVGFFTDPDHKIRYTGGPHNTSEAADRVLYQRGKDNYHGTAGFGIVPAPGFQIDFAGNYAKDVREFSISTVFRF